MSAVWLRLRADARRRWRAWLGVVVLVGLFGGIVTAAAAGARRTDDAYSRFVVANHGAPYMIDDFIPNPDAAVLDPGTLAALPSISEADSFRVFGQVADVGPNLVASPDGRAYGTGLNRLKVLRGRLPDPARADEAVADFTLPGARVGQRVHVPLVPSTDGDTHTPDLSAAPVSATFTVVGIVAAPAQFPPFAANSYFSGPNYYLTPAFYRTHETSVAARLGHRLSAVDENFFTQRPTTPTDLVNFGRIQNLPLILGLVLAVMALLTVAHLLATSIRRRRRDLAILKTLGFAHGDVGRTVAWQATTLVVPATILLANVISIGPAVTAMRTHPASVLREE